MMINCAQVILLAMLCSNAAGGFNGENVPRPEIFPERYHCCEKCQSTKSESCCAGWCIPPIVELPPSTTTQRTPPTPTPEPTGEARRPYPFYCEPGSKPLTKGDFERAKQIKVEEPRPGILENSGHLEGDMQPPPGTDMKQLMANPALMKKTLMDIENHPDWMWTKKTIPYEVSDEFEPTERATIAKAINTFNSKTCLKFKRHRTEKNYVKFIRGNNDGCSSLVGRHTGQEEQYITLDHGCVEVGVVLHEMMHAAGFYHEQSRWQRNKYIQILGKNIMPTMKYNFNRKKDTKAIAKIPYDYDSLMHYGAYAFSKNIYPTIIGPLNREFGQRTHMSTFDIRKIRNVYCR